MLTDKKSYVCVIILNITFLHTSITRQLKRTSCIEREKSSLLISKVIKTENRNQKDSSNIYKRL